ncbi:MAG: PDZ domain-containing protein [Planctomycetes bacterium]|nr:PDZ domain-containing protein [Planctomycetota bacterium]
MNSKRMIPLIGGLLVALTALAPTLGAQAKETRLSYLLDLREPDRGEIGVSILVEAPPAGAIEFELPTWAPGRWLRDDFAALVSGEEARREGDRPVAVTRVGSHRWRVEAAGDSLVFRYRIHAGRAGPGTSLLEGRGALLEPASLLPFLRQAPGAPIELFLDGPANWRWASALEPGEQSGRFRAADWNELVASPILGGVAGENLFEYRFGELGVWALAGRGEEARAAAGLVEHLGPALAPVLGLEEGEAVRGTLLLHALGGEAETGFRAATGPRGPRALVVMGGEAKELDDHLAAALVALGLGGSLAPPAEAFADWSDLPIRDDLWIEPALGFYLGQQLLARAGRISTSTLLARLGGLIEASEKEAGAQRMSLLEAARRQALRRALDPRRLPDGQAGIWIDPVSRGRALALLLDLELRRRSEGAAGLARALIEGRGAGREPLARLRAGVDAVGGRGSAQLLDHLLEERTGPDWRALVGAAGFLIESGRSGIGIGVDLEGDRVRSVRAGSAADRAGIQARDRLLRLGGETVGANVGERIAAMRDGQRTTVTVERRGGILTLPLEVEGSSRSGLVLVERDGDGLDAVRDGFLGREKDE